MKHKAAKSSAPKGQVARRVAGVLLWAVGIAAGLIGGNYGLPVALALFVAGFYLFVSASAGR
ncbi:MAG: hypothetical protein ABI728_09485 [Betaproteobacteria bacterium]